MRMLLLMMIVPLVALQGCSSPVHIPEPAGMTGISGTVRDAAGQAVAGATIYAYRNARSGLRGPADFAVQSTRDGGYLLDLAPGSFHLVTRKRSGGSDSGPPQPGDAWALPAANPVILVEGQLRRLDFTLQQVHDQRIVASTLTTAPYSIQGQLRDAQGAPLAGAMVLAYRQPELHRRPDYASTPSNPGGGFTLNLPDSGPWCLVFRQHTRGQLRRGELHALRGNDNSSCMLEAETRTDIGRIVMTPFNGY